MASFSCVGYVLPRNDARMVKCVLSQSPPRTPRDEAVAALAPVTAPLYAAGSGGVAWAGGGTVLQWAGGAATVGAGYANRIRSLLNSVPLNFKKHVDDFGEFIVRRHGKPPRIQLASNFGNAKIMAASILHEVRHLRQFRKLGAGRYITQGTAMAEIFATAPNIVQGKRLGLSGDDFQYFIDYYQLWRGL
jgi:hypothetical protein